MNNVVRLHPLAPACELAIEDGGPVPGTLVRSALTRLLAYARSEKLENTAMSLELALTAIDVDYEARRG